jgi:uncharacterized repeat protein (TIGR01451 family)
LAVAIAPDASGTLDNVASVGTALDANVSNDGAVDPTVIGGVPNLTLSKSHEGGFVAGGTGSFTLTASNIGAAETSRSITLPDTLPAGVTPTAASGTGWTCGVAGQTVTCTTSAAIPAGAIAPPITVTVSVGGGATGTLVNTATVGGGGEVDTSDNTASDPFTVAPSADLSFSKTADTLTPTVGQNVTFTLVVSNAGPSPATGVSVLDTLAGGLTFVSASGVGSYEPTSGVWSVGDVAAGTTASLTLVATAAASGGIENTAEVLSANPRDPNSTPGNDVSDEDDQATVILYVAPAATATATPASTPTEAPTLADTETPTATPTGTSTETPTTTPSATPTPTPTLTPVQTPASASPTTTTTPVQQPQSAPLLSSPVAQGGGTPPEPWDLLICEAPARWPARDQNPGELLARLPGSLDPRAVSAGHPATASAT